MILKLEKELKNVKYHKLFSTSCCLDISIIHRVIHRKVRLSTMQFIYSQYAEKKRTPEVRFNTYNM
jgi:hypothetical protein